MAKKTRGSKPARSLDTFIKIASLLLAFGAPVISLISMMYSYKEKQDYLTKQVEVLSQEVDQISVNDHAQTSDIDVFKQQNMNSTVDLDRIEKMQEDMNEKILDLYRQTSATNAQLQELKEEVSLSSRSRKN